MGAVVPASNADRRHVDTTEARDGPVVLRRVVGAAATELFLHVRPPSATADARRQAQSIYRAIGRVLAAEGADFGAVIAETVFVRELPRTLEPVRAARHEVALECGGSDHRPATTEIEQPPLDEQACLEVMVHAVLPHRATAQVQAVEVPTTCDCAECARAHGLRWQLGDDVRFHAAGLCGPGRSAYEQTLGMFAHAERLLRQSGMDFSDVVRTWIYLRHMQRDYPELNRARREFFAARKIEPVPASTGIGGGPVSGAHDLCLGLHAVKRGRGFVRTVMSSPTLNEAAAYGADFARGMKVVEPGKVALHVSGTASIDEHGSTVHVGDFDRQAGRMLGNIAALLERQGARFGDVVSAVTYLKQPADAGRLRARLAAAGFRGFPHALVVAEICRPELLCETEALAVLPRIGSAGAD